MHRGLAEWRSVAAYAIYAIFGCFAIWALVLVFALPSAAVAACPNEALRVGASSALPECMAYELVSPPRKAGQAAKEPQIGLDGDRVFFSSAAALGGTPGLESPLDPYVAIRTAAGWSPTPAVSPVAYLMPAPAANAASFDAEFQNWNALTATQAQAPLGVSQVFQGSLGGGWRPLSPLLVPLSGTAGQGLLLYRKQGVSADLSAFLFQLGGTNNSTALLPGDPNPSFSSTGAQPNLYVAGLDAADAPSLSLVARDRDGKVWGGSCGARTGARAVSADGSRILFITRPGQPPTGNCSSVNPLRILARTETPAGPLIGELIESECDRVPPQAPCVTDAGDDTYWNASLDGGRVFLTTARQLASSDLDGGACQTNPTASAAGCDLYLYEANAPVGSRLTQVSAGEANAAHPQAGAGAEVLGVVAVSGDGSRVYFVAKGVLTEAPGPGGAAAQPGQPNLYVYQRDGSVPAGRIDYVGTLSGDGCAPASDCSLLWVVQSQQSPNDAMAVPLMGADPRQLDVGGDGHVLVFGSKAPLTADDADGGMRDVFRFDADAGSLERISRAGAGGADNGPYPVQDHSNAQVRGANFAQMQRWVSEDGDVVTFDTAEGLTPGGDGAIHHFLWKPGSLTRLPGTFGRGAGNSAVSQSGEEVAFVTYARLLPEDGDTAQDVYVAREGGGFPRPAVGLPCQGETCQGPPAPARTAVPPPTQTLDAPPNRSVPGPRKRPKAARKGSAKQRGKAKRGKRGNRHAKQAKRGGGRR